MNTVNVYKIDAHLVLTGPGSKLIKEELKTKYEARWQGAPFNLWLIPNTKLKSFMKDKIITSKVTIFQLKPKSPKITKVESKTDEPKSSKTKDEPKSKTKVESDIDEPDKGESLSKTVEENIKTALESNLLDILPHDIIKEIINNTDAKTLTSLITSTKNLSLLSSQYQEPIQRQALERELKHVNHHFRKYYSSKLLDLKVNDRVIYNNRNYKIVSIDGNKGGYMVNVDMLGNVIGSEIKYSIIKKNDDWGAKKRSLFYWGLPKPNNKEYGLYEHVLFLRPGILQYDNGPEISNIDSRYLKYKTIPTTQPTVIPEQHMMVTVKIYETGYQEVVREYEINNLIPNHTSIQYAGINTRPILDNYDFEKFLWIDRLKNGHKKKIGKYTYEIVKIGGFGESDYTYNPY